MNFASKAFFIYLPLVLLTYHLLPRRSLKYFFLLLASWGFYMSWSPWYVWVIVAPTIVDYTAGLLIDRASTPRRRKLWLWTSIAGNLGLLAFFKYMLFFVDTSCTVARWLGYVPPEHHWKIILPLGISFHTFQGISYTLDVYRRHIRPVRNFVDFALFVAFFPQLVAGPIVRASEFLPQMETPPRVTAAQFGAGLHWFILGLFKKVFLADRLAQFVDPVFASADLYDAGTLRWALLAYTCQIYCDFSGYSDIAIGCARWFGFELPQNFNFPFLADSVADLWRRWHMSLSRWMRDYVYFSLGGGRQGLARSACNLVATLTLCGLWHGASWNYVLWGFYNGVLLALHRLWDAALSGVGWADRVRSNVGYRVLAVGVTFVQFMAGLAFIRSQGWGDCWRVQRALFGVLDGAGGATSWLPVWVPVLVGLVALGHLVGGLREGSGSSAASEDFNRGLIRPAVRAAVYVAAIALLVVLGPWSSRPFIYFQF
jgi:alginate O-acetyltransferase complex protein AlgI